MKCSFKALVLAVIWIGGAAGQQAAPTESMEHTLQAGLPIRWWRQPALAQSVGLSTDQQKKMDDVFLQNRLKLIELNAALEKEETLLEPMVAMDRPDENKIRAQIDRVAQARADLEKGNAYLLLGIRLILSPDQWRNLQAESPRPRTGRGGNREEPSPAANPRPNPKKSR
jgi:Spy/CpxP family protein refolding chaperone